MRFLPLAIATVFMGSLITLPVTMGVAAGPVPTADTTFQKSLDTLVRTERVKKLKATRSSTSVCMANAATAHSKQMATEKKTLTLAAGPVQTQCNKRAVFVFTSAGHASPATAIRYWHKKAATSNRLGNKNYIWQGTGVYRDENNRPYTTLILGTAPAPAPVSTPPPPGSAKADPAFKASVEKLAVTQRKSLGAKKSSSSACMTNAAVAHAKDMATQKKILGLPAAPIQITCDKRAVFVLTSAGHGSAATVFKYWKQNSVWKSRLGNNNYVWQGVGVHRDTNDRPYTTLILGTAPQAKPVTNATHVARVHTEHAKARTKYRKRALTQSPCLQARAQAHADQMARQDRMYHQDLKPILSACRMNKVGENVAIGQTSAQQVQVDWMGSAGHRENILNNDYNRIGVGVGKTSHGRLTWVVVLGRA